MVWPTIVSRTAEEQNRTEHFVSCIRVAILEILSQNGLTLFHAVVKL